MPPRRVGLFFEGVVRSTILLGRQGQEEAVRGVWLFSFRILELPTLSRYFLIVSRFITVRV